jgi:mRNA deadenylase 3'-5' endonuclease subunit Ccr4
VVPFGHFLRHTPQKDMVLPATTTTPTKPNTPTKAKTKTKTKTKKQQRSESEDGEDSEGEVVTKERKRKRSTAGKGKRAKKRSKKTNDEEAEDHHEEDDEADQRELIGSATMLHAVALIYGRCGESEQQHKECLVMVEALLGTRLLDLSPSSCLVAHACVRRL